MPGLKLAHAARHSGRPNRGLQRHHLPGIRRHTSPPGRAALSSSSFTSVSPFSPLNLKSNGEASRVPLVSGSHLREDLGRGLERSYVTASASASGSSANSSGVGPGFDPWAVEPVELSFDVVHPSPSTSEVREGREGENNVSSQNQSQSQSLVICHGLFGSKQNWRSLARAFSKQLGITVYTLDLRNHGSSPHAEPHTYPAMALDIARFFEKNNLTSGVNLLGHSMGGKTVMALALNEKLNKPLRSLISVDMSPARGRMSPEFRAYAEAMLEIQEAKVRTKSEADEMLKKTEPLLPTRQFLLTNSRMTSHPHPHLTFRVPLELLKEAVSDIGDFPYDTPPPVSATSSPEWKGPTLFLKGEHSKYLNRHNIPVAKAFFPNMRLETLDAGHWVHAEQPTETIKIVSDFIQGIDG